MKYSVIIESAKQEQEFQEYLFSKGWGWTSRKFQGFEQYYEDSSQILLYHLYTDAEGFYCSTEHNLDEYPDAISIKEAKRTIFIQMPTFIEVEE